MNCLHVAWAIASSCCLAACGGGSGQPTSSLPETKAAAGRGPDVHRLTAASVERHGLATAAASLRVLQRHLIAPARVAFDAERTAHVGCPLRGRVAEVLVPLGATVAGGDALLVVDSPELGEAQIELLQRLGALQSARPQVAFAEQAWQRAKALFAESRGVSQAEVERREAEHAHAVALVREAEIAAAGTERRLSLLGMRPAEIAAVSESGEIAPRLTIRAPFAGKVVARDVTLGELVSPDRDMLLTIADTTTLWVLVDVPESRLAEVAVGAEAEVLVGGETGQRYAGKVTLIAPMIDAATRTGEVRVVVPATDEMLRPGRFVEARLALPLAESAAAGTLSVPEAALQTIDGSTVVFVPFADETNAWLMRPVEVGRAVDGYVPVHAGLRPGEQVVTTGSFILKAQATQGGAAAAGDN